MITEINYKGKTITLRPTSNASRHFNCSDGKTYVGVFKIYPFHPSEFAGGKIDKDEFKFIENHLKIKTGIADMRQYQMSHVPVRKENLF